jgi:hypothetical protein
MNLTDQQRAYLAHVGRLVRGIQDDPYATATTLRECDDALAAIVAQGRSCGLSSHAIADAMNLPLSVVLSSSVNVATEVSA